MGLLWWFPIQAGRGRTLAGAGCPQPAEAWGIRGGNLYGNNLAPAIFQIEQASQLKEIKQTSPLKKASGDVCERIAQFLSQFPSLSRD